MLIERAVRQGMLDRQPYRALDYLLAVDDVARIGAMMSRQAKRSDWPWAAPPASNRRITSS